jgi:hypothetical protein
MTSDPRRARECRLCKYAAIITDQGVVLDIGCLKDHKPRFYRRYEECGDGAGWRRVCSDFEETGGEG